MNLTTPFLGRSRTLGEGTSRIINEETSRRSISIINRNLIDRILGREEQNNRNLEEIIDPEQDYERFRTHGLRILNPEALYNRRILESRTQFFRHHREIEIQCLDSQVVKLNLISEDSKTELKKRKFRLIHLGLIVIGIKGLTRKNLGCKTLITIYYERFNNIEKGQIASMEVDMNNNNGIIYCNPDFLMTINDFSDKIKIGIQTKGYEEVNSGNNLQIHVGFLGRCSINSQTRYKVYMDKVVGLMSSKGINMVKPKEYSSEQLAGLEWNMNKFLEEEEKPIAPKEALTYKDAHGRTSLRFTDYRYIPINKEEETQHGEEPYRDNVHIELVEENLDKIIFPKEINMDLSKEELIELEDQLFLSKQITEEEFLYYDLEQNIRIGIIKEEDDKTDITNYSYTKELMDDATRYKAFDETPFDKTVKHEVVTYGDGFPPRRAYSTYNEPLQNSKYVSRGSERPLEQKITFQTDAKVQILNITSHDPQTWTNVIEVWKNTIIGHYIRNIQD